MTCPDKGYYKILVLDRFPLNSHYQDWLEQDPEVCYQIIRQRYETLVVSQVPWYFDVILLDPHFADTEGFDILEQLQAQLGPSCPPTIVIDQDDVNLAVRFMKAGAADYLAREQITAERLIKSLHSAIAGQENSSDLHAEAEITRGKQNQGTPILDQATPGLDQYVALFNLIDEGCLIGDVIFDEQEQPIDIFYREENPAATQITGQHFAGRRLREIDPNYEQYWCDIFGRVAKTGQGERFVEYSRSHQKWCDCYVCKIGDQNSEKVAIIFQDITDRKQAEASLAANLEDTRRLHSLSTKLISEQNIQVLYNEIMATAIALVGADAGSFQIFDETRQELVIIASQGFDETMTHHFHRVDASSNTPCGVALAMGKRTFVDFDGPEDSDPEGSLQMHLKAGYLSGQSTPLMTRSQQPIGMVSTHWRQHHQPTEHELRFLDLLARQATDILEQRQAQAEREQLLAKEQAARQEAEKANRVKDDFLSILSHELRTPLNPILGWTRLLQKRQYSPVKTAQALAIIERNVNVQVQLVDDLLDMGRMLRGKLSLKQESVDLPAVINAAIETVQSSATAKSISIHSNLSQVGQVLGDPVRLQQIVWNLLSNAIKFTPEKGRVDVYLEPCGNDAQLQVADTGKGIPGDFLPHIFDAFCQEDASVTRNFGGLGLGLAIVKYLVQAHGGTITAHSAGEGQGATFTAKLPLCQKVAPKTSATEDVSASDPDLRGIRVLAVDDEPDARELLTATLTAYNAQVKVAASGREAWALLNDFEPEVLISDLEMPNGDGYELIENIRALPAQKGGGISAIALTAFTKEQDSQRVWESGYQDHLAKPLDPDQLVKTVAKLAHGQLYASA